MDWLTFHPMFGAALGFAILATVAAVADRRRFRRRHPDRVGLFPWRGVSVFAIGATLISTALAIKAGL